MPTSPTTRRYFLLAILILALSLSGCTDGPSGLARSGTTPPVVVQPPTTPAPTPVNAPDQSFPRTTTAVLTTPDATDFQTQKTAFERNGEYQPSWTSTRTTTDPITGEDVTITLANADRHLRLINASAAYARGATGLGETILIMDTGIRDTHREFQLVPNDPNAGNKVTKETDAGYTPTTEQQVHGTAVAGLAAGNRGSSRGILRFSGGIAFGFRSQGVAFDAGVYFREVSLGSGGGVYRPLDLQTGSDEEFARFDEDTADFVGALIGKPGAVINFSFGYNGVISDYARDLVRARLPRTAARLEQRNVPLADKQIVVWAAGNGRGRVLPNGMPTNFDSSEILSGLGAYFPELQTHVLTVVATDQDGEIASYSNHCGIAKAFCLAAPGSGMITADPNSDSTYFLGRQGTSFAAPLVSGGIALLRQYFRGQLGNHEIAARILATANRTGIYTNSDIYGHGLLDLDAATAPVGALAGGLGAGSNALGGVTLSGGAFGDAVQRALDDVEMAAFDELGAPFFIPASAPVTQVPRLNAHATTRSAVTLPAMNLFGGALQLTADDGVIGNTKFSLGDDRNSFWFSHGRYAGVNVFAPQFVAPYLSLVNDGQGLGWSRNGFDFALIRGAPKFAQYENIDDDIGEKSFGALFNYQPATALAFQAGSIVEVDGLLGTRANHSFGGLSGATTFAGIHLNTNTKNNWNLNASAFIGDTRVQLAGDGFLRNADNLLSTAFILKASKHSLRQRADKLHLTLSQPLRVEHGGAQLRLPSGRTKYGEVLYANHDINLAPRGRTVRVDAGYDFAVAGGEVKTQIAVEREPGHLEGRGVEAFLGVLFERGF